MTERSLLEAAELAGLGTDQLITRFLPYSTKGRLPAATVAGAGYLAFPPIWRVMGKQSLYVGMNAQQGSSPRGSWLTHGIRSKPSPATLGDPGRVGHKGVRMQGIRVDVVDPVVFQEPRDTLVAGTALDVG